MFQKQPQQKWIKMVTRPGKRLQNYWKSPFFLWENSLYMAIFNSYVSLPEGTSNFYRYWSPRSNLSVQSFATLIGRCTRRHHGQHPQRKLCRDVSPGWRKGPEKTWKVDGAWCRMERNRAISSRFMFSSWTFSLCCQFGAPEKPAVIDPHVVSHLMFNTNQ